MKLKTRSPPPILFKDIHEGENFIYDDTLFIKIDISKLLPEDLRMVGKKFNSIALSKSMNYPLGDNELFSPTCECRIVRGTFVEDGTKIRSLTEE